MHINEIKRVIVSQKEEIDEIFKNEQIIEREFGRNNIERYLSHPNILTVLGIRRCGKSIFSLQVLGNKKIGYINFDDERLVGLHAENLELILQAFYELYGTDLEYILLDEPQNIERWELFANRLRRTKKIIITGSNSKILSGDLATHLTGRHMDVTLFPFSFKEFLRYRGLIFSEEDQYSTKVISSIRNYLKEYTEIGGFPEVYKFGKKALLRLYEDIINKDIFGRYNIRHKKTFKDMARYLISNFSGEFTYNKLKNIFAVKDVHTVKNWVDYLSATYLVFTLERFSYKLKEQSIAPKKIYTIDVGLADMIGFKPTERRGAVVENLVFLELLRRQSYQELDSEVYYWKDPQQREVDFIVKEKTSVKQLIQVCTNLEELGTKEREINSLLRASKELRCTALLVITEEYEAVEKIGDKSVCFVPLWKWLLEQK